MPPPWFDSLMHVFFGLSLALMLLVPLLLLPSPRWWAMLRARLWPAAEAQRVPSFVPVLPATRSYLWDELEVVAVADLIDGVGLVQRSPIVRDALRQCCFVVVNVQALILCPNQMLPEEEVQRRVNNGSCLFLGHFPAQQGYAVLVADDRFLDAFALVKALLPPGGWRTCLRSTITGRRRFAYLPQEAIAEMRACWAADFIGWLERNGRADDQVTADIAEQALWVVDRGHPSRGWLLEQIEKGRGNL